MNHLTPPLSPAPSDSSFNVGPSCPLLSPTCFLLSGWECHYADWTCSTLLNYSPKSWPARTYWENKCVFSIRGRLSFCKDVCFIVRRWTCTWAVSCHCTIFSSICPPPPPAPPPLVSWHLCLNSVRLKSLCVLHLLTLQQSQWEFGATLLVSASTNICSICQRSKPPPVWLPPLRLTFP